MTRLSRHFGVKPPATWSPARPSTARRSARVAYDDAASVEKKIAASVEAFKAWRDVPAPRRGELVRLFGEELRANKDALGTPRHARSRQDPAGRPRRSAGDDRHLRFRGRSVAPALRPDHRLRTPRPSHDGDLASGGSGRRHLRVQFSRRGVGVECGAGAGLRRQRDLEAVRENAADGARDAGAVRARAEEIRRRARESLAGRARPARCRRACWRRTRAFRWSAPRARRAWAASLRRSWPRASANPFSSSAATTP